MKKILCLLLCLALLLPTVTACSRPPEYSEIEARLKELVEASYEINEIFFGLGLATYERVYDPRTSTETYIDKENGVRYHYFTIPDPKLGDVIALRQATTTKKWEQGKTTYYYYEAFDRVYGKIIVVNPTEGKSFCLQMVDAPIAGKTPKYEDTEKGVYGYEIENYSFEHFVYLQAYKSPKKDSEPYYHDTEKGVYYYQLKNYVEPKYDSFYDENDPVDYDFVRIDSGYLTIEEIKQAASRVYSAEYLSAVYKTLFEGAAGVTEGSAILSPRYMEYTDPDSGELRLMKSNTFAPLVTEKRIFDFSTAKMVRPMNGQYVTIEIESYRESSPEDRLTVRLSMRLQDGEWMLDSATY